MVEFEQPEERINELRDRSTEMMCNPQNKN